MTHPTKSARLGARAGILITLASGFLALTSPAFAAADDDVPQATLNVAGTDFTSDKAIAHLTNRIRHTARQICSPDWDGKSLSPDERKCYDTAMKTGLAQIESKRMAALRRTSPAMASAQPEEHQAH